VVCYCFHLGLNWLEAFFAQYVHLLRVLPRIQTYLDILSLQKGLIILGIAPFLLPLRLKLYLRLVQDILLGQVKLIMKSCRKSVFSLVRDLSHLLLDLYPLNSLVLALDSIIQIVKRFTLLLHILLDVALILALLNLILYPLKWRWVVPLITDVTHISYLKDLWEGVHSLQSSFLNFNWPYALITILDVWNAG